MFLTPEELQQLTGYHPRQRMRICRWLDAKGIPYTVNRLGDPVVLKSTIEGDKEKAQEPQVNLSWIKKSA